MKTYALAKPALAREEERAVLEVLRSGTLSLGPKLVEFETQFARLLGVRYACGVSSGTAGLHLALLAAGIGAGEEVITTPFSFVASANAVLYVGARPVFIDIDPVTYNLDPAKIERAITRKTRAILVVHIFGQAAAMAPIMALAKKYRLKVIEDACESIEATYQGQKVGTFGESAVFSFYPNKQITTGEGGIVVTNNKRVYELCRSLRNQGRASNMQWLDHERLGYNYRLSELSAALGAVQLGRLDDFLAKRRALAVLYHKHLAPFGHLVQIPLTAEENTHSWFVYVLQVLKARIHRDRLIEALVRVGISTKPYLPAIHLFRFYKEKFKYRRGMFPVAEAVSARSLALPFHLELRERDVRFIVERLVKILEKGL